MMKTLFQNPKTEKDMIMDSLERLHWMARCEEEKLRLGRCRYKWEIGIDIIDKVYKNVVVNYPDTKKLTLFGEKVDINYDEKTIVKLWREVEA